MSPNNRKARRQSIRYTAWLMTGPGRLQGCVLSDISDAGARIEVEDSKSVPDRFLLLLALRGGARRVAKVVWRKRNQLGVKFERSFVEADNEAAIEPAPAANSAPGLIRQS